MLQESLRKQGVSGKVAPLICTGDKLGLANLRSGVRVAEGARLESVYTATYRGFESLSLRHIYNKVN